MVKREGRQRWRRVLILALFLLIPALLSDLPLFSKTGHPGGAAPAAAGSSGGGKLALLPVAPGALAIKPGRHHWHAASGAGDAVDDRGEDALLHNLVYLTHDSETQDDNKPLNDGGDGLHFGGDGGGHPGAGGGGGPTGFGGPGYDPGTDILPLAFTPDDGNGNKGGGGSDPPFLSPTLPSIAAVPEPATWALFILGFGFIGAQLRRARDAQPVMSRSGRH
ncbi:MAG TPA: PEPxxWA-CTERM sorting domain-containing protein [Rhizomicrobium sp.]|jgi:hypothetical protein